MDEPTRFVEANALLAVQAVNDDHAKEILRNMYPSELRELMYAADQLAYLARRTLQNLVEVPIEESVSK